MAIRGIIFDLDDTLIDTTGLLIPLANTPEYTRRIREPLPLLDGAAENLEILKGKYKLALITQGHDIIQSMKIQSSGLASFFPFLRIVSPQGKPAAFEEFLKTSGFSAQEILSCGNRRSTDLRPAKALGMKTCFFEYGEHKGELPEGPEDIPDYVVSQHRDLIKVCQL